MALRAVHIRVPMDEHIARTRLLDEPRGKVAGGLELRAGPIGNRVKALGTDNVSKISVSPPVHAIRSLGCSGGHRWWQWSAQALTRMFSESHQHGDAEPPLKTGIIVLNDGHPWRSRWRSRSDSLRMLRELMERRSVAEVFCT